MKLSNETVPVDNNLCFTAKFTLLLEMMLFISVDNGNCAMTTKPLYEFTLGVYIYK